MTEKQATCEERIDADFESTMTDLRELWACYTEQDCPRCEGEGETQHPGFEPSPCDFCNGTGTAPESHPDLGEFFEYGLSFDYIAPGTWGDEPDDQEGYWRYQLSWGGPSDEFRFYASTPDSAPYRVEYWFMDWFDGAHRNPRGTDLELLEEIWSDFQAMGIVKDEYNRALED